MTKQFNEIARKEFCDGLFYTIERCKYFSLKRKSCVDYYVLSGHYSDGNIRVLGVFDDKDYALRTLDTLSR